MKTLSCDLCDHSVQGDSFESWMESMKPHYAAAHADFMKEQEDKPKEAQMAEMNKWMSENRARFEAQPEDN